MRGRSPSFHPCGTCRFALAIRRAPSSRRPKVRKDCRRMKLRAPVGFHPVDDRPDDSFGAPAQRSSKRRPALRTFRQRLRGADAAPGSAWSRRPPRAHRGTDRAERAPCVIGVALIDWRVDRRRHDGADMDVRLIQNLLPQALAHAPDSELAGDIGRRVGLSGDARTELVLIRTPRPSRRKWRKATCDPWMQP